MMDITAEGVQLKGSLTLLLPFLLLGQLWLVYMAYLMYDFYYFGEFKVSESSL